MERELGARGRSRPTIHTRTHLSRAARAACEWVWARAACGRGLTPHLQFAGVRWTHDTGSGAAACCGAVRDRTHDRSLPRLDRRPDARTLARRHGRVCGAPTAPCSGHAHAQRRAPHSVCPHPPHELGDDAVLNHTVIHVVAPAPPVHTMGPHSGAALPQMLAMRKCQWRLVRAARRRAAS